MPDVQEQLQIIIRAQDEASATLKKVEQAVQKTGASTEEMGKKSAGAGFSVAKMAGAFALGGLVTTALQRGMSYLTDTIKGSINAYREAEVQTAQTNTILKTMNTSLNEQAAVFQKAAKASMAKAFDDEAGQLALAKLYQRTNDMKFAQEALTSAMDLARYKGISLEDATNALGLAFMGSGRVLKQLGIEVEDGASKLDILSAVQDKTKGSAEAFANTYEGKTRMLGVAVGNLKETLGKAIVDGISPYVTSLTNSAIRANDAANSSASLGKVIYQVVGVVKFAAQGIMLAIQGVQAFVKTGESAVRGTLNALDNFSTAVGNSIDKVLGGSGDVFKKIGFDSKGLDDSISKLSNNIKGTMDGLGDSMLKITGEGFVPATAALSDLSTVNQDYTAGVKEAINANQSATQSLKEHKKAIEDAKGKINDFRDSAVADFKKVGAAIKKDLIDETKNFMAQRAAITAEGSSSVAKILVSKQDEAAQLQQDINQATTDEERASLQERLAAANAYLVKHAQDISDNAAAIKFIRDNDLTDEINQIKQQTIEKLKALDDEHAAKIVKIKSQMDDLKTTYKAKFDDMYKELKKSKLFELFDDLENIGAKLSKKKNKTAFESSLSEFIGSLVGKRAMGGSVEGSGAYVVGERGPELFRPNVPGTVLPASQTAGSVGGPTINFNGITVRNDGDINSIVEKILGVLGRRTDLARKGIY